MERLSRRASGVRHLRWGREVLATAKAHLEVNDRLSEGQRAALLSETEGLGQRVGALEAAVGPYRVFVDGAHVQIRASKRVANYLCDEVWREADGAFRHSRVDLERAVPGFWDRFTSGLTLSRVLRAGHEATVRIARKAAGALAAVPADRFAGAPGVATAFGAAADRLDALLRKEADEIDPQRIPLKAAVEGEVGRLRETLEQMDGRLRSHFSAAFIESLYPELSKGSAAVADEADDDDDTSEAPE